MVSDRLSVWFWVVKLCSWGLLKFSKRKYKGNIDILWENKFNSSVKDDLGI